MSVEEFHLPQPDTPPQPGYLTDHKGHLVPEAHIKPVQALEDQMVRRVMGFAVDLANQIRRFKGHVFADTTTYMVLAEEQYGATKRGAKGKGNVTFQTFDGLMQIRIAVADRLTFGPELQVARGLFAECIDAWAEGARDELRTLVDDAFQADKEGQVSRDAVFRLLRLDFEDRRWQSGQEAIKDSIRVIGSKSYARFYIRDGFDAPWTPVPIDIAAV
ncbi:DUF3164 family protein [Rhodospirillum sp. A1_3_36]|uniref:DUF3164 family protein n=1 Tax=Rhodospirillum sp. A1_3_36 TaxID=3391666 RepID=UPI0039A51A28